MNVLISQYGSIGAVCLLEPVNLVRQIKEYFFGFTLSERKPLKYIGFNGTGHQVRDVLHPKDLVPYSPANASS